MEFKNIKNANAKDLDQQLVIEIINKAYNKCDKIMQEAFELDDDAKYTFEMTQNVLLCTMFDSLMNISETIGNLSDSITVGAFEHLVETLGLTEQEVLEMEEDEMEHIIKPYLDLQHKYADFNNNELRDMLFETAKNLLTPVELMTIYLGF